MINVRVAEELLFGKEEHCWAGFLGFVVNHFVCRARFVVSSSS